MEEAISYKTIFILDCSHEFRNANCGKTFEVDVLNRNRQTSGITPLSPISKSLYTCSTEAIFEYSRIVWDLFPNGEKLLKFICCSPHSTHSLNTWETCQQNYDKLTDLFASLNTLKLSNHKDKDLQLSYLINGFKLSLSAISSCKELPKCKQNFTNSGRIILLSHFNGEKILNYLKEEILKTFSNHNQNFSDISFEDEMYINNLDVILINTFPVDTENKFKNISKHYLSDNLAFTFYSVSSSSFLASKLTCLAFEHYDLSSTTVSGIPMKEEQNAGSSANYDVEIVHSKKAHSQFFQSEQVSIDFANKRYTEVNRDGQDYRTLILKWCTAKNSTVEMNYCIGAYRITAVDICSRPSSCLINFLHGGKAVILEMNYNGNTKKTSHVLQSHNGELYIHVFACTRPLVEDAPSISDGVGGHVTDYRFNDFADFIEKNHLSKICNEVSIDNLDQSILSLKKQTLYWPISLSFTVFFNSISDQLPLFYQLISKEAITEHELIELKNIIFNLVSNESKCLNLPLQSNIIRNKGLKKEDYYRIMWNEMEHVVRCFNDTPEHQSVLKCLLECKPTNCVNQNYNFPLIQHNELIQSEENKEFLNKKINFNDIKRSKESLQHFYHKRLEEKKRRPEFVGHSKKVKLYAQPDKNVF